MQQHKGRKKEKKEGQADLRWTNTLKFISMTKMSITK